MIHASGRSLGRGFKQPFGCLTDTNLFPATEVEHAQLEAVYIYFDTATYDEIERDEKVLFSEALEFRCFQRQFTMIIQR